MVIYVLIFLAEAILWSQNEWTNVWHAIEIFYPRFRADLNTEAAAQLQCDSADAEAAVEPEKGQIQGHQRVDFGLSWDEMGSKV